jgi:alkylation response protein AidB-like acyl-CoA dehydrogenase
VRTEDSIETAAPSPTPSLGSSGYQPPLSDLDLALDVAGLNDLLKLDAFRHADRDSVSLVMSEFGRLAAEVITASDRPGDIIGAQYDPATGGVHTPQEFHRAYGRYVDGGWGALPFPSQFGGGGLPSLVGLSVQEVFASANMALALTSMLTQGAIEALLQWGSDEQRSRFLPRLLTGEWTGAMNLTEPDAGSDLGEIRTRAELADDGSWRVTGTKIFITWGEHDLTENIVHLVLARTPEAPPGTRGLSLFLVSQRHLTADGSPDLRNDVRCRSIEKKLGIHGSPTCVMEYDGATAEMIGPQHNGMKAMFTMMNAARLSTGAQGPAVGERSFQQAYSYASSRLQGRAEGVRPPALSPILDHPDVRRMLLLMSTTTQASRLLLYTAAAHGDRARHLPEGEDRERSQQFVDLLTPVAKAWSTDAGLQAASLGIQVMGGAGYIEESGMAQRLRDARIAPVYEGTNGIQALDLAMRKLPRQGGRWVRELLAEASAVLPELDVAGDVLAETRSALAGALATLGSVTTIMEDRLAHSPRDAMAGATSYLELFGNTIGGWLMARRALLARSQDLPMARRAVVESEFFAVEVVERGAGLVRPIGSGAAHLDAYFGEG